MQGILSVAPCKGGQVCPWSRKTAFHCRWPTQCCRLYPASNRTCRWWSTHPGATEWTRVLYARSSNRVRTDSGCAQHRQKARDKEQTGCTAMALTSMVGVSSSCPVARSSTCSVNFSPPTVSTAYASLEWLGDTCADGRLLAQLGYAPDYQQSASGNTVVPIKSTSDVRGWDTCYAAQSHALTAHVARQCWLTNAAPLQYSTHAMNS